MKNRNNIQFGLLSLIVGCSLLGIVIGINLVHVRNSTMNAVGWPIPCVLRPDNYISNDGGHVSFIHGERQQSWIAELIGNILICGLIVVIPVFGLEWYRRKHIVQETRRLEPFDKGG